MTALVAMCWKKKVKASSQKARVFSAAMAAKPAAKEIESCCTIPLGDRKLVESVRPFAVAGSPSGR
jgi:hypothetical protein